MRISVGQPTTQRACAQVSRVKPSTVDARAQTTLAYLSFGRKGSSTAAVSRAAGQLVSIGLRWCGAPLQNHAAGEGQPRPWVFPPGRTSRWNNRLPCKPRDFSGRGGTSADVCSRTDAVTLHQNARSSRSFASETQCGVTGGHRGFQQRRVRSSDGPGRSGHMGNGATSFHQCAVRGATSAAEVSAGADLPMERSFVSQNQRDSSGRTRRSALTSHGCVAAPEGAEDSARATDNGRRTTLGIGEGRTDSRTVSGLGPAEWTGPEITRHLDRHRCRRLCKIAGLHLEAEDTERHTFYRVYQGDAARVGTVWPTEMPPPSETWRVHVSDPGVVDLKRIAEEAVFLRDYLQMALRVLEDRSLYDDSAAWASVCPNSKVSDDHLAQFLETVDREIPQRQARGCSIVSLVPEPQKKRWRRIIDTIADNVVGWVAPRFRFSSLQRLRALSKYSFAAVFDYQAWFHQFLYSEAVGAALSYRVGDRYFAPVRGAMGNRKMPFVGHITSTELALQAIKRSGKEGVVDLDVIIDNVAFFSQDKAAVIDVGKEFERLSQRYCARIGDSSIAVQQFD